MVQVIVGELQNPALVLAKDDHVPQMPVTVNGWRYRAMWSWLRLQHGRSIDQEIKDTMTEAEVKKGSRLTRADRKKIMNTFFAEHIQTDKPRRIQFIMDSDFVIAVATLKHLLIPPSDVYTMATKIIETNYPTIKPMAMDELQGLTFSTDQIGIDGDSTEVGFQVHGGTITTRQAITVSSLFRVRDCLNPLSFLGIGNFRKFLTRTERDYERVLRIKVKSDLEPRLRQGIDSVMSVQKRLNEAMEKSKEIPIDEKAGKLIATAMCWSYHIGSKVINQVIERFMLEEEKTKWGLAMATSWVARHGEFKADADWAGQRLGTISGATMLIDKPKDAEEKSLAWLKEHIKDGRPKPLEELLKEIMEKK